MSAEKKQRSEARLDFRLSPRVKDVIERAACATGQTVNEFAVSVLYQSAQEVLERERLTKLSDRDAELFLRILDAPARPNKALKAAAKKYKSRGQ